jgi:hypothetical protein
MAAIALLIIGLLSCKKAKSVVEHTADGVGGRDLGVSSTAVPNAFRDISRLPGSVFQVTYTPNTVRIDLPTAQRVLRSISRDGRVLVFDAGDSRVRDLKQGNVLLLEHLGVRRVAQVLDQGSSIAILTEDTSFTDFIQDGTIKFSAPADFHPIHARVSAPRVPRPARTAGLLDPLTVYASEKKEDEEGGFGLRTGEFGGWEFELDGEPKEGGGLALTLDASKKIAGLTAGIKAKGEVSHIDTTFNVSVSGGKIQDFQYETPLQGKLDVTWSVLQVGGSTSIGSV